MEYADNGDLYQKIQEYQKKNAMMPEQEIWNIFIQIVKGLKSLHDLNIYHRDLKSANVFLNKDGTVQLGDMNVSKVAKQGLLYTQTGTPYYASPEVWKEQPYDHKSDIWSLGCVIYEMTALKPPFRAEDMEGLYKRVIKGNYPKIPSNYSSELAQVIKSMLQTHPNSRPSCDQLLILPSVSSKLDEKNQIISDDSDLQSQLLNTIKLPKNLLYLTDRLPKATYPKKMKQDQSDENNDSQNNSLYAYKKEGIMLPTINKRNQKYSLSNEKSAARSIEGGVRRDNSVINNRYQKEEDEIYPQSVLSKQSSLKNNKIIEGKRMKVVRSLQGSVADINQDNRYLLNQLLQINAMKNEYSTSANNEVKLNMIQRAYNMQENPAGKRKNKKPPANRRSNEKQSNKLPSIKGFSDDQQIQT